MELVQEYRRVRERNMFMEMVRAYNRLHIIDRIHYITMESVINDVTERFRGQPKTSEMQLKMKVLLEEHMINRGLHKYFQLELSFNKHSVGIKVHEVNRFHRPKECVIWN
jgi:hypothetical protein